MLGRRLGIRFVRCRRQSRFYSVTPINDRLRLAVSFSSWQYDAPWRRIGEEHVEKAKRLVQLQKHRDELITSVQSAVRAHLRAEFPTAFEMTSSRGMWKNFRIKELSGKAHILLELNGFEKVSLPKPLDMLMLAEGVVAFPNFYSRLPRSNAQIKFLLFSQPMIQQPESEGSSNNKYPAIVQEDIQLYRVLENQAEGIIDAIYNTMQGIATLVFHRPIEIITQQIRSKINMAKRRLLPTTETNTLDKAPTPNIRLPSVVHHSDIDPMENLLVMGEGRDELKLYAEMRPSVRLVALPFALGHKSASTLVSVSLVLFGAIPLAYRSLNYAFLYPGLSEALAASVIGTITYGIWSQRYNARVSQSHVVTNALLHRLQARDDAVVLLLQEGAVRQVSQAVLAEYFDRLDKTAICDRIQGTEEEVMERLRMTTNMPSASTDLVDPLRLAVRLGLLNQVGPIEPSEIVGRTKSTKFRAVSLEDAASRVQDSDLASSSGSNKSILG